ncbi:gb [Venturia nashicola]|uniref:Gb n=1 Tax=Venturia nashicola TaxID=86259 RepID=A0A4Z1NQK9_9PEZI|nr:gb [Venturia nashicola]TLD27912.1 gb [Venturia nashicola]
MTEPALSPPSLAEQRAQQYVSAKRNLAIGLFVACPVIALLPPRKLDLYTLALGGVWVVSANHVSGIRSGRTVFQRLSEPAPQQAPSKRYEEMQRQLRERGIEGSDKKTGTLGVVDKIWMGDQGDDWQAKRAERERKVLQNGEGYGTLIMDQIKEVWTGKKREEDNEDEESKGDKTQDANSKS